MTKASSASSASTGTKRNMLSASKRAGLRVGVPRLLQWMRSQVRCARFSSTSKITLSAAYQCVLERLQRESVLRKKTKATRLNAKDILRAVTEDAALRALFGDAVTVVGGGYPRIIVPRAAEAHARDIADESDYGGGMNRAADNAAADAADAAADEDAQPHNDDDDDDEGAQSDGDDA